VSDKRKTADEVRADTQRRIEAILRNGDTLEQVRRALRQVSYVLETDTDARAIEVERLMLELASADEEAHGA